MATFAAEDFVATTQSKIMRTGSGISLYATSSESRFKRMYVHATFLTFCPIPMSTSVLHDETNNQERKKETSKTKEDKFPFSDQNTFPQAIHVLKPNRNT